MMRLILLILFSLTASWASAQVILRPVTLEWEEVSGSQGYEVEITSVANGKKTIKPAKVGNWKGELPMGLYSFRIRSLDERGVGGPWSPEAEFRVRLVAPTLVAPLEEAKIPAEGSKEMPIQFSWKPVEGAASYLFEIESRDQSFTKDMRVSKDTHRVTVNVPHSKAYQWRVVALLEGETPAAKKNFAGHFAIIGGKLGMPQLVTAASSPTSRMVWTDVPSAETYEAVLMNKDDKGQWKAVLKEDELETTVLRIPGGLPDGEYRMTVVAKSKSFDNSEPMTATFVRAKGVDGKAGQNTMSGSGLLSNQGKTFDIWTSYTLSMWDFRNTTLDSTYEASQPGGTGRLRGVWYPRDSEWQYVALGEITGIDYNGVKLFPTNGELYMQSTRASAASNHTTGFGLFYRETPEFVGNKESGVLIMRGIFTGGPMMNYEWLYQFNSSFYWLSEAKAYMNLISLHTPNGGKILNTFSYALLTGAVFPLSKKSKWMVLANMISNEVSYANNGDEVDPNTGRQTAEGTLNAIHERAMGIGVGYEFAF